MEIRREGYASAAAQSLVQASVAEMLQRYDGRGGSGAEPRTAEFESPTGAFLVGFEGEAPVACGGICRYDDATGEIRRMYVARDQRGGGLSRQILRALEEEARALGYGAIRLETGNRQPEAVGLYRSAGYEPIPRYGPYVDDERSLCFEKRL
jgi:GNAT superfamily N-acetyltransferase